MIKKIELRNKLIGVCGCGVQHTGWPCNTCFHAMDLELKQDIHEYWIAVLAFRGDYPDLKKRPELIQELWEALNKRK